jgi:Chromo (CHRromatin Organisation MOdifier) domain
MDLYGDMISGSVDGSRDMLSCRIHSSLGYAPLELIISRPTPSLSVETPEKGTTDTAETARMRFLDRLKEFRPLAKKKLAEAQARYKATFYRSVRENNKELQAVSWVYVRKEVHGTGTNPKLDAQVHGPYLVLETDGRTFQIQQGEQKVRISSDRFTPAPDLLGEVRPKTLITPNSSPVNASDDASVNKEENQAGYPELEAEYVVERIVGVRQGAAGKVRYRIRWYANGRDDDTWEPLEHLPEELVRIYHRRTRLPYPQ